MNNTPNTQQTSPSKYHIEKESTVNATNELLKWYHGCTGHFTAKAKEIIDSSDNPDIIEKVFADFLNDEATVICREIDFLSSGDDDPQDGITHNDDDVFNHNNEAGEGNPELVKIISSSLSAINDLQKEGESANYQAELYKACLEGNIEAHANMLVEYKALARENEELKNRLNQLLYGNQESGE